MAWYDTWFGSDAYKIVYRHRDDDEAATVIDLVAECAAPDPDARILDVGCGRGRHTLELARRGYDATGIDLSEESVQEARRQAATEGLDVSFAVQDMREPYCDGCMDGVVNLFTTFGYFDDDAESQRAVRAMASALRPGGWIVQDFLNPPHVARTLVERDQQQRDGVQILQKRWIEGGRVHKEIHLDDGTRSETFRESVRLFSRNDFAEMYADADLEIEQVVGDYHGTFHDAESPRTILFARKKDA
jgi:SAM-dependent methyltransferase